MEVDYFGEGTNQDGNTLVHVELNIVCQNNLIETDYADCVELCPTVASSKTEHEGETILNNNVEIGLI